MRILSAPLIFNPACEPRPHPLENRAPIAQPKSRTSVRQTERVLLRTSFAQGLCAGPVRTTFAHLLFSISPFLTCGSALCAVVSSAAPEGGSGAAPEGVSSAAPERGSSAAPEGVKMAGATPPPPRLRTSCGSDPRMQCASRGPVPPSLRGGRSRHSDPCRKARIAED